MSELISKVLIRIPEVVHTVEVFAIYCASGDGDLFFLNLNNDSSHHNG